MLRVRFLFLSQHSASPFFFSPKCCSNTEEQCYWCDETNDDRVGSRPSTWERWRRLELLAVAQCSTESGQSRSVDLFIRFIWQLFIVDDVADQLQPIFIVVDLKIIP